MKKNLVVFLICTLLTFCVIIPASGLNIKKSNDAEENDDAKEFWPSARYGSAMVYSERASRFVLFGGDTESGLSDETWTFDYDDRSWTKMDPVTKPSARIFPAMAYLNDWGLVFMFGGQDNSGYLSDTWVYDYDTNIWSDITPTTRPSARAQTSMAYYDDANVLVLFGGLTSSGQRFDDTWEYKYSGNTWNKINPVGNIKPSARSGHAMASSHLIFGVLLFGGKTSAGGGDETWIYEPDENRWTNKNPSFKPDSRFGHRMVYDGPAARFIMFGGYDYTNYFDDTWSYYYRDNIWTEHNTLYEPSKRYFAAMAYDNTWHRTILFGGYKYNNYRDDETYSFKHFTEEWERIQVKSKDKNNLNHELFRNVKSKYILFLYVPIIDRLTRQFPSLSKVLD